MVLVFVRLILEPRDIIPFSWFIIWTFIMCPAFKKSTSTEKVKLDEAKFILGTNYKFYETMKINAVLMDTWSLFIAKENAAEIHKYF